MPEYQITRFTFDGDSKHSIVNNRVRVIHNITFSFQREALLKIKYLNCYPDSTTYFPTPIVDFHVHSNPDTCNCVAQLVYLSTAC